MQKYSTVLYVLVRYTVHKSLFSKCRQRITDTSGV